MPVERSRAASAPRRLWSGVERHARRASLPRHGDPPDRFYISLVRHPHRRVTAIQSFRASPRPGPRTRGPSLEHRIHPRRADPRSSRRRAGRAPMRREVFAAPGGDGLALQPAERPHPPLAHPYIYPHGVAEPVDARDGGPVLPQLAWAGAASTAGAMAGDVPSLARWARAARRTRPATEQPASDDALPGGEIPWDGYGLGHRPHHDQRADRLGPRRRRPRDPHRAGTCPGRNLTIAITWNDDVLNGEAPFLRHLVALALAAQWPDSRTPDARAACLHRRRCLPRPSRCAAPSSATGRSRPSTASTSSCPRARASACSVPTARASRRRCACSPRRRSPTRASCTCSATGCPRSPRSPARSAASCPSSTTSTRR